jgi:hypothetical protein
MKNCTRFVAFLCLIVSGILTGCGGSSSPGGTTTPPPASPTVSSISPTTAMAGSGPLALTVNGSGFLATTTVQVGDVADATSYVSATQVTATVTPQQLASGAQLSVIALNGSASSGSGAAVNLAVTNPVPAITAAIPITKTVGAVSHLVSLVGASFVPTTVIDVNGSARTTVFVSPTQVDVALTAADLSSTGSLALTAVNGAPGGGTSAAITVAVNNPPPGGPIKLSPSLVLTGATTPTTVTVTGTNFIPASSVVLGGSLSSSSSTPSNGIAIATTYVSSTQLTFQLTVAEEATSQQLSVSVVNPAPGGGTTLGAQLDILPQTPQPLITSVLPSPFFAGSGATTMTVNGTNLFPVTGNGLLGGEIFNTSNVLWNGASITNGTGIGFGIGIGPGAQESISVTVPASLLASAGTATITVSNPTSTPALSNALTVSIVNPPVPTLTSLNPGSGPIDTAVSVFLLGTGFASNSTVAMNGINIASVFLGSTELEVSIPASSIATPGTVNLTVTTPAPGGGTSAALPFTAYNPPAPTLTLISPNAGPINTAANLTLNGTGFSADSTVALNGTEIAATYVSPTELTVALPASSVALPGNVNFTVTTPAPGGGTTAPMPYTAYIAIPNNSMVYNPVNGLFYVSVPSSAGAPYGNSVVSVDPETGALGKPIPVGSEPDRLAISSDGTILWVGLDGASAVRQVNLSTGTAGLQFSLGGEISYYYYATQPAAYALAALPGSPNSVVVATNGGELGLYDNGVLRGTTESFSAYALQVNGTTDQIYAGANGEYAVYTYSAAGLTQQGTTVTDGNYGSYGNDDMQVVGGDLYTDFGTVDNAETGAVLGTFYLSGTAVAQGPTVADTILGKVFILDDSLANNYGCSSEIQIFSLSNYTSTSTDLIRVGLAADFTCAASHLARWGTNGLAFRTGSGVYSLQSNLVKNLSSVNADLGMTLTASGGTTTGTKTTYTATVTNAGPSASSDVALTAQLPTTAVLISAVSSVGTCSVSSGVSCDLGGLANGATATVTIVVEQTTAGSATASVEVSGPENDTNTSNNQATAKVTVTGSTYNVVPALNAITPAAIESGSSDSTITLTGAGFTSGSTVQLGTLALATSDTSSTTLTATIPAAQLASLGWQPVTVSNPTPGGGTSNPLPLTVFQVLTLGANHILYEPFSRKLYASVSSDATSVTGNTIAPITPDTGSVGTPVFIGSQPTKMAISDDGNVLYSLLGGANSVALFNLQTQTTEFTFSPKFTNYGSSTTGFSDIAVQPGSENTIVVDSGDCSGMAIIDVNPTAQTAAIRGSSTDTCSVTSPQFYDPQTLYVYYSNLDEYAVTASGFSGYNTAYTSSPLLDFGPFKLSDNLAFAAAGGVADVFTTPATQVGYYAPLVQYGAAQQVAPDTSLGQVFFLSNTSNANEMYSGPDGIVAYNQATYVSTATLPMNIETIEGTSVTGIDLIRWGQDGLAALASSGNIYLLRGPFVVPELLNQNSAASLTSSSATSIAHGAGNTLLTLTGSNFLPGVAVTWNGSYRTTTIVDATHVTVAIPASDLASAGSRSLVATNPGAPASDTLTVTIN